MASSSNLASSSAVNPTSVTNNARQQSSAASRQTRTNPSRTSRTLGRSSFAFGHSTNSLLGGGGGGTTSSPGASGPHGFYPALTHFTDSIAALPREFRRHNSLLKEVDAKAWALEENLLQWLQVALHVEPSVDSSSSASVNSGSEGSAVVDGRVARGGDGLLNVSSKKKKKKKKSWTDG